MAAKPQPQAAKPRTEVAVAKTQLPVAWRDELASAAKDASATETPSVGNISFRSGVLSYQGQPIPGNTMTCIVVGTAFERSLYEGAFDPNKIKNPICFALTLDGEQPSPHENSAKPQHEQCHGCAMDEWGSAGEGRRGKACKELRRLALIPADKLETVDDILASELAMAKVPVTSVRNWSNYVHKVSATMNRPYWSVVTRLTLRPHIKNQFEVFFDVEETVDDGDALAALKRKREHVEPFVLAPYSMATEEEEAPAPAPAKPGKPAGKRKF